MDKCTYAANPDLLNEFEKDENFTFTQEDIATLTYLPDCDYVINIPTIISSARQPSLPNNDRLSPVRKPILNILNSALDINEPNRILVPKFIPVQKNSKHLKSSNLPAVINHNSHQEDLKEQNVPSMTAILVISSWCNISPNRDRVKSLCKTIEDHLKLSNVITILPQQPILKRIRKCDKAASAES